jgi:glutamate synthase domain-containing protein 1/glutamate synthase domain-containing protein 3
MNRDLIERLTHSRGRLAEGFNPGCDIKKSADEGGCGVVGFCCTEPVAGRHIYEPSMQMHNRGNGKGGGIAAVGFDPEQLGVSRQVLDDYYMLHIALLDAKVRPEVEKRFIKANFEIAASGKLDTIEDWQSVEGLQVRPPDVWRYFVRAKDNVLEKFITENKLQQLDRPDAEDEFVNQNSFKLNQEYYASLGEQKAFVLSHGRNIMILKVVGYAEAIVKYYRIEDLRAHVWIAHQRYPTKGRVWHPGGAHPFAGIDMALVHNGDFANYHSVSEYLKQRNIYSQFLTDTEVSALLFDLLERTYRYPLEYIIEAMAPTTERDFDCLDKEKQKIYRAIQATHIHGSPDGPWFFIIARNIAKRNMFQLLGITDTAMLRPQVFAFSDGEVQVGLICSEKQAIDATLLSLSKDDERICPVADRYWNARGGSHTDGGAFIFNLVSDPSGRMRMECTDKFGVQVPMPSGTESCDFSAEPLTSAPDAEIKQLLEAGRSMDLFEYVRDNIDRWSFDHIRAACRIIAGAATEPKNTTLAIEALTLLNDRRYATGSKKPSHIIHIVRCELDRLFRSLPGLKSDRNGDNSYRLIDFQTRDALRGPQGGEKTLVIDATGFPSEGDECDAGVLRDAFMKGWRRFITFGCRGQRYVGCGLGPETSDVTIDIYGSSGDYLGSGIDGLTITVHGNAQDQLGQIIKHGKLVVHGDTGQTFMYGAKGGEVYVLGNAAGRPLINSVGRPKAVINGTCLDFLAESFMAGDPLKKGGFVILNGVKFDDGGRIVPLPEPYPGSNLFSLASGGAIYVRDPDNKCDEQQLNGGQFVPLTDADWELMLPYLHENERLFGISVEDLLTVDGRRCEPTEVYRKVTPSKSAVSEAIADTDDVANDFETAGQVMA